MLIAETLRIPAQEAAQTYVDSGMLAGHATRGYAKQVAETKSGANHLCKSAFWNMDERIQRAIAGRIDFSPTTNMLYVTPMALEDAINDLVRIADSAKSEAEARTRDFRAAKGQGEEIRNAIIRQIDAAEGRECSANILTMLAAGCKILAENQKSPQHEAA